MDLAHISMILRVVLFLVGLFFVIKWSLRVSAKFQSTMKETKHLPVEDQRQAVQKTKEELLKDLFSVGLHRKFWQAIFSVVILASGVIFLVWVLFRAARWDNFLLVIYILLACCLFCIPIFLKNIFFMRKMMKERREAGKSK